MKNHGYTLVEAIIYIAILAVLAVTFVSLLFTMVRAYTEFQLERSLTSSASLGLERLVRETRQAKNIDPASTLGSSPGRLLLNTTDEAGAATTRDFYLSLDTLMVKEGSGAAASTTAQNVTVDNLIFRQINTPNSQAVKIEMTLTAKRGTAFRTQKFYSTAVLRGSY
ncbi:MAG: type II secretion system protein [Candidatus Vogelbacteria bacterium]